MATNWIPVVLLLCAPTAPERAPVELTFSSPASTHIADLSAPRDDIDDLFRTIKKEGDDTPFPLYQRLARFKTEKALNTLKKSVGLLRDPAPLFQAYRAFQEFEGTAFEQSALDFLEKDALRARRDPNKNGATRALVLWGTKAADELTAILVGKVDEELKSIAVQPMIETLGERGDATSLEILLKYGPTDQRSQPRMKGALEKARGSEALKVFEGVLSGKRTDPARKRMLIDVLGTWKDPDADLLIAGRLRDADPDIVVRALEILGQSKDPRWIEPTEKLLRSKDEAVLREAILTMSKLSAADEVWVDQVFAFADDKRAAARMGAAAALVELRTPQAIDVLHGLLADPNWRVRSEALQQVGNLRRAISVPVLIERLDAESGRLAHDIAVVLRLVTGEDHGRTGRRWSQWWRDQGDDYALPTYEEAVKAEEDRRKRRKGNESQASFYGLEIVSDRVMFIIDQSGSMAQPAGRERSRGAGGGPTRLDLAVKEFGRAIAALPDEIGFNVIFFESGIDAWKKELIDLDEKTRAEANTYARDKVPAGATNVYGALLEAYEDERIDTIYLLTDGDPSAGEVIDPNEIRRRIQRLNRTRRIVIHCISIGQRSAFLEALANENGGSYTESL